MKIVGVIGGMGPQATIDLFQKIVDLTPATKDQDHVRMIIYNNSLIPDRTGAILGMGLSPLSAMIESGKALINAGAEILAMPCNTAHYFISSLKDELGVPFIHMLEEVACFIRTELGPIDAIGLLATDGTITSKVYHKVFEEYGINILVPHDTEQRIVMDVIYGKAGVKAGIVSKEQSHALKSIIEDLKISGAQTIIAGCTELPCVLERFPIYTGIPIISSTAVLASAIIREGLGILETKPQKLILPCA
jgi:aspartate racemase